ncbi:hypothetical protein [Propionivibrio sp.]|uniref:hypothetical protein n=1 Tax=Propionivibrio sp. TaxID=2212460 RepID=UPI0026330B1C|nr:hypothetical protein [Propionivibrio sp.]
MSTVSSLEVRLNNLLVGYLTHYPDEKTMLDVWRSQFQAAGVPEQLIQKVEAHQAQLPLTKSLNG